jgi:hypothetical protein
MDRFCNESGIIRFGDLTKQIGWTSRKKYGHPGKGSRLLKELTATRFVAVFNFGFLTI